MIRAVAAVSSTLAGLALAGPAAAATLQVGPGQTYPMPCDAIAAASPGDTIEVDAAGAYDGNTCAWTTDGLTITGVNGRAKIDLTGVTPAQEKGIFTIGGTASATIENFELSGAAISSADGNNGAGIRHQGLNLTVRNCYIHDNQDGILGAPATANTGTVLIENSEFASNGAGDGYSHNMYIGDYAAFTLEFSYSHLAVVGHLVKSRAYVTQILYNRLTDELGGTASYETDIPNGGTAFVIGNLIEQSAASQNPNIVSFGEEGLPTGYDSHLYVVNNTVINDLGSGTFVVDAATTPAVITNNILYNGGAVTSQAGATQTTNFTGNPMFVDVASYDVSLLAGSPCINAGTDPGTGSGQSLTPVFEYVQPLSEVPRTIVGSAIDIGAYEYGDPEDAGVIGPDASPPDGATPAGDGSAGSSSGGSSSGGGGSGAGSSGASSSGGTGDGGIDETAPHSSSGCSCRAGGVEGDVALVLPGLAVLVGLVVRRRR
jgi:MYXO-CTERM domain-containing protein